MFAVVESGKITSMLRGNKGITIGDNQYDGIFTLWVRVKEMQWCLHNRDR